jgi:Zn-finger nucleic acid-binding protein
MKKNIKEYRIEIAIVLLIVLGIFLLIERMELRSLLTNGLQALQTSFNKLLLLIKTGAEFYILDLSISDFLGWVLLILAVVLAIWVARYRFNNSSTFQADRCPKCGSALHRVHRKYFDRLLSRIFLPHARRYRCANHECHWTGLRHPRHRYHQQQVQHEIPGNP